MEERTIKDLAELAPQAERIIKNYAFRSSMTGFIPIPLVDTISLMGVQRFMLFRLSKLYGVPFKKSLAKITLTTLMSGVAPRVASSFVASVLKLIPGVGTLGGGASMAILGSASTYAVGKVFQKHFESGGTLNDFDPEASKERFEAELEKGVEIAASIKSDQAKKIGNEL